ncbi:MAG: class I SAM-dependent methyltransferase [Candidatus Micrarchaeota archaeon]
MYNKKPTDRGYTQYPRQVSEYMDKVANWNTRARSYGNFFCKLLDERGVKRVLDMSTGTGFDTIMLLKNGFDVVSLDGSVHMLKKAKENARRHGVSKDFLPVAADWRQIGNTFRVKFQAALCLGNSFCHLRDVERRHVIKQVRGLLEPTGVFIVDYRNFDSIINGNNPVYGRSGYYSGEGVKVTFTSEQGRVIEKFDFVDGGSFVLKFHPVPLKVAINELEDNGFTVTVYSDFKKGPNEDASFYQLVGKAS